METLEFDERYHNESEPHAESDRTHDSFEYAENAQSLFNSILERKISLTPAEADTDSVTVYLREIGTYPLLDKHEEIQLSKLVHSGMKAAEALLDFDNENINSVAERHELVRKAQLGKEAKQIFILCNLRLVVSIAKRYPKPLGLDLQDLIQEGNLGLEHAVDKYDGQKGFKFSTYATFWIRQSIGRAIESKSSMIRLPNNRAQELRAAIHQENNNIPMSDRNQRLLILSTTVSLDNPIGDDGTTLKEVIPSTQMGTEEKVTGGDDLELAARIISELPLCDQELIRERYGFDDYYGEQQTIEKMAVKRGVSRQAIAMKLNRIETILKQSHLTTDY